MGSIPSSESGGEVSRPWREVVCLLSTETRSAVHLDSKKSCRRPWVVGFQPSILDAWTMECMTADSRRETADCRLQRADGRHRFARSSRRATYRECQERQCRLIESRSCREQVSCSVGVSGPRASRRCHPIDAGIGRPMFAGPPDMDEIYIAFGLHDLHDLHDSMGWVNLRDQIYV